MNSTRTQRPCTVTVKPTDRDRLIFQAIATYGPLTLDNIIDLSQGWPVPFTEYEYARQRLRLLSRENVGLLAAWRYATTSPGASPYYFKLTRKGYRTLHHHRPNLHPPRDSFFTEMGVSRHRHTRDIADCIVHCVSSAARNGIEIIDFFCENTQEATGTIGKKKSDFGFTVVAKNGDYHRHRFEIDEFTEPIHRSTNADESLIRTIQIYDDDRNRTDEPYFVAFITTGPIHRVKTFKEHAAKYMRERRRTLFVATWLEQFLGTPDPIYVPCFTDHRDNAFALLPPQSRVVPHTPHADLLASTILPCYA